MNKRSKCCCKNGQTQREIIAVRASFLDMLSLITEASVYQRQRNNVLYETKTFLEWAPQTQNNFFAQI